MRATPFHIDVTQSVLDDLKRRLIQTRWPDAPKEANWNDGTNIGYLRQLVSYWIQDFNWRDQEKYLNGFQQFKARIDGLKIHFIHECGVGPKPMPLILTHGWPSSFFEMTKIIPLLTDPASHGGDATDAFDVVVPSLPGYGFSQNPNYRKMTLKDISDLWTKLMVDILGYRHFGAHGGDIGAGVATNLGRFHPENMIGIHILAFASPILNQKTAPLTEAEQQYVSKLKLWEKEDGAYEHQQSTRPQTLAYGLNDSPTGLAAWIIEKFRSWSDCNGEIERRFSKDELLTNLTIYWITETINSSIHLYYDHQHSPKNTQMFRRIEVPTGATLTVEPVNRPPREWVERTYNVQRWTELPRGGHFAAFEEPELLAREIRAFFRPFRK
ncbi:epoxide hydrolase family protein [Sporolactobacillus laevolacticus]|uniref:Multidrug MFS transporter n=1 Tax=Sporolactobacillus laevolacticus DSM 442 TaxID=1395513 RepID=V6IV00_9BACL|nr:epoxide hydrolase family protein [Sporolactobacillus laevolacticus]EST10895.1 multidrug MFS transporter [Sporolactobacillus laevolacticus DSM 442]